MPRPLPDHHVIEPKEPPVLARFRLAVFAVLIPWFLAPPVVQAAQDPGEPVGQFVSVIQEVFRRDASGIRQQVKWIHDGMARTFAVDSRARAILGSHWEDLNPEQRERFVRALRRLNAVSLYGRLMKKGYQGVSEETGRQPITETTVVIEYQLTSEDGEGAPLRFLVQKGGSGWLIANLEVNGVSDLALNRTRYRSILEDKGVDALIAHMEERLREIAKRSMPAAEQPDWQ